jgi:hypothetical protein
MSVHLEVATQVKQITLQEAINDFRILEKLGTDLCIALVKGESRVGNKFIDYFTFEERLATKTRKGMNFYEFVLDLEYHQRPYIKKLLLYQIGLKINLTTKLYRIYSLHCGAVSLFKPLTAMKIYAHFKPQHVLDPCMGWGGRLVGAVAANVPRYTGIDLNVNLKEPYKNMIEKLNELTFEQSNITAIFCDAVTFDYSKLNYDMILTSPPYFNIEQYSGSDTRTKKEWKEEFYRPLFEMVYKYLLEGGVMCINLNEIIYETIFIDLFGRADILVPMSNKVRPCQSEKQKQEYIYCWIKKSQSRPFTKVDEQ